MNVSRGDHVLFTGHCNLRADHPLLLVETSFVTVRSVKCGKVSTTAIPNSTTSVAARAVSMRTAALSVPHYG